MRAELTDVIPNLSCTPLMILLRTIFSDVAINLCRFVVDRNDANYIAISSNIAVAGTQVE